MTVRRIPGSYPTAVALMAAVVDAYGEREALVDGEVRLTFAEWDRAADAVAAGMHQLGVGKGDVVCLHLPSSADYAVCYQAAMRLGAITSGINPRSGPTEVASILDRTSARLVVCDDQVALSVTPPGAAAPASGAVMRRSQLGELVTRQDGLPAARRPRLHDRDPVAIVWTSGTTGEPKGAVFDHANLEAVARGAGVLSQPGDRRLSPLPFAHVGYMARMWDELAHVITSVIVPAPWQAAETLRLIEAERITVGQGVPAQWTLMLAHRDLDSTDVSSLRLASTGASTVPPELVRDMKRKLGCPVVVRYASTEAGGISTGSRPEDADEVVVATVGRSSAGVEVAIADEEGQELAVGTVGSVRVRSGAVMRSYWKDPIRTAQVLTSDGWLITGDLGSVDADGNLTLVGRRAEMYIRGGYNVYPTEVEAVLAHHPAVAAVAVIGVPDAVLGQIGAAVVAAAAGADPPTLDDLRGWCRARLADYKAPDRLRVIAELPLTSMAKVDKLALAELLMEEPHR